jgi:hypothetical protein
MANGKNNYGFNVVGAQGLPSLVSTPQIQPSRGLNIPVPALRKERQSGRDTTRAALLGALSPSIAGAALKGLAEIPALEKFIYEAREDKPTATEVDLSGPISDPRLAELQQRRAELDKQYPSLKPPETKTNFGNLLENILTYAPGLALGDEPGTAQAFLGTAQSARKLSDTLRATRAAAAADRETTKFTKLLELKDFERKITNSSVLMTDPKTGAVTGFQPFQREVLVSPTKERVYIQSRGDKNIDYVNVDDSPENIAVPAGQYYIKEEYALSDVALKDPDTKSVIETNTNKSSMGRTSTIISPDGRKVPVFEVINDKGEWETLESLQRKGENWVISRSIDQAKPPPVGDDVDQAVLKDFEDQIDRINTNVSFAQTAQPLLELLSEADRLGRTDLKTATGGVYKGLDRFYSELSTAMRFIGIRRNYGFETKTSSRVLDLVTRQAELNKDENVTEEQRKRNARALASQLQELETEQGRPIKRLFGMDIGSDEFINTISDRASIRAGQIRLAYAYAAAKGQTGTALSDRDVINALVTVGAEETNPYAIGHLISGLVQESIDGVDAAPFSAYKGKNSDDYEFRAYLTSVLGVSKEEFETLRKEDTTPEQRTAALRNIYEQMMDATSGRSNINFKIIDGKIGYFSFEDLLNQSFPRADTPLFDLLDYFKNARKTDAPDGDDGGLEPRSGGRIQ